MVFYLIRVITDDQPSTSGLLKSKYQSRPSVQQPTDSTNSEIQSVESSKYCATVIIMYNSI